MEEIDSGLQPIRMQNTIRCMYVRKTKTNKKEHAKLHTKNSKTAKGEPRYNEGPLYCSNVGKRVTLKKSVISTKKEFLWL